MSQLELHFDIKTSVMFFQKYEILPSNHAVYIFKKTTKTTTTKTITCITICISPTFFNALYTPFFPYFFRSHIPSRHEREVSEFRKLEREKSFDEGNYTYKIYFFPQITTFIKICLAFVFGLQTI